MKNLVKDRLFLIGILFSFGLFYFDFFKLSILFLLVALIERSMCYFAKKDAQKKLSYLKDEMYPPYES